MQKYRSDESVKQSDNSVQWFAKWFGGPTLAKIDNCQIESLSGDMRRTVYITGDADTYFSTPAVCKIQGCRVRGYVTPSDSGNLVFRHVYY